MPLSPLENPITYRNREIVRRLTEYLKKQLVLEALTWSPQGAAQTTEAIEYHLRQIEAVENRGPRGIRTATIEQW